MIAVAAFVQSATGFGFALLCTPVLLWGLDPHTVVPLVLLLHSFQCGLALASEVRLIDMRQLGPLVCGGVIGTPPGVLILRSLSESGLYVVIGCLVFISGVLMVLSRSRPLSRERAGAVVAGLISGLLNGGSGIGGPPVAIYVSNQAWPRAKFRVSLMVTFLASNLVALALFVPMGLVQSPAVTLALVLTPAVLVGWAARRTSVSSLPDLSDDDVRRLLGTLVTVAGIAILLRA